MGMKSIQIKQLILSKPEKGEAKPTITAHFQLTTDESYFGITTTVVGKTTFHKDAPFQDMQSALIDDAFLRLQSLSSLTKEDWNRHLSDLESPEPEFSSSFESSD